MTVIDWMRLASMLMWSAVFLLLFGSIRRMLTGKAETLDPIWSLLALFAATSILYQIRWYVAVSSLVFYFGLHALSIGLAARIFWVAWSVRRHSNGR